MPVARHRSRNLILSNDVQPKEVRGLAERKDWVFEGQIDRNLETGTFYEVRWDTGGGSVHYVIEEFADLIYMVVRHDDRETAERMADLIARDLRVWSLEEMLHDFDVNVYPAGWARALSRLGVGAPCQENAEVLTRLRESIHHTDTRVRWAAVWAMSYTKWPVCRDMLADIAAEDEEPEVSKLAAQAIEHFDR